MKKLKVDPGTIVYVIWQDAASYDQWDGIHEHAQLSTPMIHSIGFLLKLDKTKLTICLSIDQENGHSSQSLSIPRQMIKQLSKIKQPTHWA